MKNFKEFTEEKNINEASKDRFINRLDLEDWQKDALKDIFASSPQLDSKVDWHRAGDLDWEDWEDIIVSKSQKKKESKYRSFRNDKDYMNKKRRS